VFLNVAASASRFTTFGAAIRTLRLLLRAVVL